MRSAVFGRYWATAGGAEKYGGVIAQHLAKSGEVDLLTFDPIDLDHLAERLQLDLSGVRARVLDDSLGSVTAASADYDRFVNVSFMSADRAAHANSLYVVHFPTALDAHVAPWKRAVLSRVGWLRPPLPVSMAWGTGFHHTEGGRRGVTWTAERATLSVTTPTDVCVPIELVIGSQRPQALGPYTVRAEVDGSEVACATVVPPVGRLAGLRGTSLSFTVRSPRADIPVEIAICVDSTFVPADVLGSEDRRVLGAPLRAIRVGRGPRSVLAGVFPSLGAPRPTTDWASSYGALVSNSEFTRSWVRRYWDADSEVLYPPVTLQSAGTKEPVILNVGRFFAAEQGHSKKQLELVQAFRDLYDAGERAWSLHLVGGCATEGMDYLNQVRVAATGYPIELHVNASGTELQELYARASIYWHASGLGEDQRRHPDRLEHFGIATVEAMSAGAVPVVVGLAGQLETVRHGIDGYHFDTVNELAQLTRVLMDDPVERERMAASARRRSERFSTEMFEKRLSALFDRIGEGKVP